MQYKVQATLSSYKSYFSLFVVSSVAASGFYPDTWVREMSSEDVFFPSPRSNPAASHHDRVITTPAGINGLTWVCHFTPATDLCRPLRLENRLNQTKTIAITSSTVSSTSTYMLLHEQRRRKKVWNHSAKCFYLGLIMSASTRELFVAPASSDLNYTPGNRCKTPCLGLSSGLSSFFTFILFCFGCSGLKTCIRLLFFICNITAFSFYKERKYVLEIIVQRDALVGRSKGINWLTSVQLMRLLSALLLGLEALVLPL